MGSEMCIRDSLGTLMGVAAAGAFCYAMGKTEQENAREDAKYSASRLSQSAPRSSPAMPTDVRSHRNYSTTESRAPRSHRNFSVTESYASRRYPPRSMRTIGPSAHHDDNVVQDAISRYTASRRPSAPQRSMTMDAIEYMPASTAARSSHHTSKRSTNGRSAYAGLENNPWSEAARSSRTSAKRSSTMPVDAPNYYIEAAPRSSTSRQSRHRSSLDDAEPKRRDSAVSVHSHRSRHTAAAAGESSRRSSTSTVKPSKYSAVEVPLPPSKASSYVTAAHIPIPESHGNEDWAGEDSDGLGDTKTVVPDDSISCIDFSKPQRYSSRSERSKSSRQGSSSKRSEAADSDQTVRAPKAGGSRHSARTLPARSKDDYYGNEGSRRGGNGKRSAVSYA